MKVSKALVLLVFLFCEIPDAVKAQSQTMSSGSNNHMYFAIVEGKDTIPWVPLPEVDVYADAPRHLQKRVREWNRLVNAVYATYPYARIASVLLTQVQGHLDSNSYSNRERRQYIKSEEKELKQLYGPGIEDLSIYQGKILIKLIYRETGANCYDIIKQMRGGFNARLWQTVAFVFGSNLKTDYNKQQDADIESIVEQLESNPYYYNAIYYSRYYRNYN